MAAAVLLLSDARSAFALDCPQGQIPFFLGDLNQNGSTDPFEVECRPKNPNHEETEYEELISRVDQTPVDSVPVSFDAPENAVEPPFIAATDGAPEAEEIPQ